MPRHFHYLARLTTELLGPLVVLKIPEPRARVPLALLTWALGTWALGLPPSVVTAWGGTLLDGRVRRVMWRLGVVMVVLRGDAMDCVALMGWALLSVSAGADPPGSVDRPGLLMGWG